MFFLDCARRSFNPYQVGKAARYRSKQAALGHNLDLTGRNAPQSAFVFDG
jgi:hypothetical protein